jgi:SAM-dependent methyltransferase
MTAAAPTPTFRDPAGSVSFEAGRVVRRVHGASRAYALDFVHSEFYRRLVARGDMVPSEIDDGPDGLRLLHPEIDVATYPWEWCAAQWLAAAELTLQLGDEALVDGWVLKDATPLNILFVGPRPVLVDVLSFERLNPATSTWLAYAQYMRTFLLPLLANKILRWPLELSLFKRDGYEPIDLYNAMGWGQRLSGAALWPVTLPALLEKRQGAGDAPVKVRPGSKDPQMNLHLLRRTVNGLLKSTRKAMPADFATEWSGYTGNLSHYTVEQSAAKFDWVRGVLREHRPANVLDIGANTGEFSRLASVEGAQVVALERDAQAANKIYNASRKDNQNVLTVHADLSRPTPAVGWNNSESVALLPRLAGQFDLVMMLAVIHHILLLEQIPLASILELMHSLTRDLLIVEWVPVSDPMFQSLMRGRDELYGSLSSADLFCACEGRFTLLREETLGNGRVLYLFRKLSVRTTA